MNSGYLLFQINTELSFDLTYQSVISIIESIGNEIGTDLILLLELILKFDELLLVTRLQKCRLHSNHFCVVKILLEIEISINRISFYLESYIFAI